MLLYLVNVIRVFIPLSLITGMVFALWKPIGGKKTFSAFLGGIGAGLLCGMLVYIAAYQRETLTAARSTLFGVSSLAALLNGIAVMLPGARRAGGAVAARRTASVFLATLAASLSFSFLSIVAEQALSSTTVLNTELILNISGILLGTCFVVFLIPLILQMSAKSRRGLVVVFLLLTSALLVIPWCAEIVLGLMRLEMAEITSARLSFVAKAAKYAKAVPYVLMCMTAFLSFVYFTKRTVFQPDDVFSIQRAARRKIRGRMLFDLRWIKAALVTLCSLATVLLYHDLYASRPPKISTPVAIAADESGLIKVKISDVADGKLHRYSHVTDDGHVVRFVMINRSKDRNRIGVVYDACMLCGDMGYVQKKNEVTCLACNVRIFTPSIGKAGGCNPIPLAHSVQGEYVVVSAAELDKGARYFSEVVEIAVKDPVTGKELNNRTAPNRWEYNGRTYFFESQESQEKFMASPETYIGVRDSRYERVQGYPSGL